MTRTHPEKQHTLTGDFRFHNNFHSQLLARDRDVIVYLPPRYKKTRLKRYPVLYLNDGQNLFDGATSFIPGNEWRVDETAERLIKSRAIEPLIVVGIYNTGVDRVDEYTPTPDPRKGMGGKADLYARMILEELKPFIDANYRTLSGPKDTGIGGSSLGGLVSLYIALNNPEVFGRVAALSPSVWWDNRIIVRQVNSLEVKPQLRIWLDIGTAEGEAVKALPLLRDALVEKGWKLGEDLSYYEAPDAVHDERAWAKRVEPVLRFLFPRTKKKKRGWLRSFR
ncbi:MAG TPA: alpha/beta hydrolase-fold protein [Blastocatellia bacterium]|nr:alpha/beta hydrolase-fold protein [Blastocatellia bacterium]